MTDIDRVATRKAVLHCPVCERSAPIDGEWTVTTTHGTSVYTCPTCGTVLERRPTNPEYPQQASC